MYLITIPIVANIFIIIGLLVAGALLTYVLLQGFYWLKYKRFYPNGSDLEIRRQAIELEQTIQGYETQKAIATGQIEDLKEEKTKLENQLQTLVSKVLNAS